MEGKQDVLSKKFVEVIKTNNLENKEAFEIAKLRTEIYDVEYSPLFDTLASLARESKKNVHPPTHRGRGNPFHKKPMNFAQKMSPQKQKKQNPEIMKNYQNLKNQFPEYDEKYLMFCARNKYFNDNGKSDEYHEFLLNKINEKMNSENYSFYEAKKYAKNQWYSQAHN